MNLIRKIPQGNGYYWIDKPLTECQGLALQKLIDAYVESILYSAESLDESGEDYRSILADDISMVEDYSGIEWNEILDNRQAKREALLERLKPKQYTATYEIRKYDTYQVTIHAHSLDHAKKLAQSQLLSIDDIQGHGTLVDSGYFLDDAIEFLNIE